MEKNTSNAKAEVISIKRSPDSIEGSVIAYLKNNPLLIGSSMPCLVMSCLRAYWMPLLLHQKGASDEQVKQASVWAIAQLSSQIEIIRQICLAQTSCSQPRQLTLPFDNGWSNSHSIEELEKQLTEI